MTKRIFNAVWSVTICVLIAASLIFLGVLYNYFTNMEQAQLRAEIDMVTQGVSSQGKNYLNELDLDNVRVTWIDEDGDVIYDNESDSSKMENHLRREEIREAKENGTGESSRYSTTLTEKYLYCAKLLDDGTVIRLAIAENSIIGLILSMLQPLCVIIFIALVLSVFIASRASKSIVKPLNNLNLEEPLENKEYDELSPLLRKLVYQQNEIKEQTITLRQKKQEFDSVTSDMSEGIMLLSKELNILSINEAAVKILELEDDCIGLFVLSVYRGAHIQQLLKKALEGYHSDTIAEINERKYQFNANPVISDGEVSGIAVLILDVTEKEELEKMKREFTANVSHELRTPLHTISGCAELMANGMVKESDMPQFADQIYSESQRMIKLVEDIIQLSRLDEGAADLSKTEVDIKDVAENAVKSLQPKAEENNVKLSLSGESSVIDGVPGLIYEIIYNLCDNGIKYNRENGEVNVSLKSDRNYVTLTVSDTGIGIPKEHRERIFERFYRVDKSHSKETGGTGLGLSIVKHAAQIHNAEITLESECGKGTAITVKFRAHKNAADEER